MQSELPSRTRLAFVILCAGFVGGQWLGATLGEPLVASFSLAPVLPFFFVLRETLPLLGVNHMPGLGCLFGALPVTAVLLGLLSAPIHAEPGRTILRVLRTAFAGAALAGAFRMPWTFFCPVAEAPDSSFAAVPDFFVSFYASFERPLIPTASPIPAIALGFASGAMVAFFMLHRGALAGLARSLFSAAAAAIDSSAPGRESPPASSGRSRRP